MTPAQRLVGGDLVLDVDQQRLAHADPILELERHRVDLATVQERAVLAAQVEQPIAALRQGFDLAVAARDVGPVDLDIVLGLAPDGDRLVSELELRRATLLADDELRHTSPWDTS